MKKFLWLFAVPYFVTVDSTPWDDCPISDPSCKPIIRYYVGDIVTHSSTTAEDLAEALNAAPAKHFVKPSPAEATAYAKTIGFNLDGGRFCDYYEANGWKVGRNPMKSWQAAVRTWKNNGFSAAAAPVIQSPKPYREHVPDEKELPMPSELKVLLSGLGKGIPK